MKRYTGFIYEWTNQLTGKKYLGSHRGTTDDGYIGSGVAFLAAYSSEHFVRKILEYVEDDDILVREQYWLDKTRAATRDD